jgi:ERCC4-related helicase
MGAHTAMENPGHPGASASRKLPKPASRIVKAAVSKDAKRRSAEKKQLQEIKKLIEQVQALPDPKIEALIADLQADVLSQPDEKAIIFTEYLDTLGAIKAALDARPEFKDCYVDLTGGTDRNGIRSSAICFIPIRRRIMSSTAL